MTSGESPDAIKTDPGIYPKYIVFHHPSVEMNMPVASALNLEDGGLVYLEQVNDFCFVLKPIHDIHARIAMAAYAESVKYEKPQLALDIKEILSDY